MLNQKGITPVLMLICALAVIVVTGGSYYISTQIKSTPTEVIPNSTATPLPTQAPTPTAMPTVTPTIASSIKSGATVKPTATPSPTPTPMPKVVCDIRFDPTSGSVGQEIKLIYGAAFYVSTGDYVTNVQWDFDGDQHWDTDYSINNQHYSHVYDKAGTYNVHLQLQTKEGQTSEICTKSLTIL